MPFNIEFKARTNDMAAVEKKFLLLNPAFIGEDHQVDTYFNVHNGRLKLREGNIENALIHYERENKAGSKSSRVLLYQHAPEKDLKAVLAKAIGIKTVVDKKRRIYFIGNVKFHFDTVQQLGSFIEVEAIDYDESIGKEALQEQCDFYAAFFEIQTEDFVSVSYSDLLINL